jgi:hypothetical protein
MTTRALQFDVLLTPVHDYRTNSIASGYTVEFYAAGTTTAKNVWTEKEKTNPFTSRTLGSDGTVQVYGDGVYKILIKDADDTTVYTWDNVKCQANTFTVQSKSAAYTVTADDDLILVDTTAGDVTINLATVTGFTHPVQVKVTAGANNAVVTPSGTQTIDGAATDGISLADGVGTYYPDTSAIMWRKGGIGNADGLTASVAELNILDGKTFYDEDDMASNSAVGIASQQSIKAYHDSGVATLSNKTLTSPKLNEDVVLVATSSEIDAVVAIESQQTENTGIVTVISTLTTLVNSAACAGILDDFFDVAYYVKLTKGATGGNITLRVMLGTAGGEFEPVYGTTSGVMVVSQEFVESAQEYISTGTIPCVVTTAGDFLVRISALSAGSDSTVAIGDAKLGIIWRKKM